MKTVLAWGIGVPFNTPNTPSKFVREFTIGNDSACAQRSLFSLSVNCFNFKKSRRWAKLISKLDSVNTIPRQLRGCAFRAHAYTPS